MQILPPSDMGDFMTCKADNLVTQNYTSYTQKTKLIQNSKVLLPNCLANLIMV
jgi:hypothetical protein